MIVFDMSWQGCLWREGGRNLFFLKIRNGGSLSIGCGRLKSIIVCHMSAALCWQEANILSHAPSLCRKEKTRRISGEEFWGNIERKGWVTCTSAVFGLVPSPSLPVHFLPLAIAHVHFFRKISTHPEKSDLVSPALTLSSLELFSWNFLHWLYEIPSQIQSCLDDENTLLLRFVPAEVRRVSSVLNLSKLRKNLLRRILGTVLN